MGRLLDTIQGLKPAMMMVVVQAALAGVNIFYKLAGNMGMSLRVLIGYRFLFAAAFIVPLALVIERKSRPKLTWVVVCQAFFCGLFGGCLAQNLYAESLVLTSATFAAAMTNLIPAITLILAVSFGMEKLGFGTWTGKAKVVGTFLCIGGAMLLTFYKGAEINLWSTSVDLLHKGQNQDGHVAASHQKAALAIEMRRLSETIQGLKPAMMMVVVQALLAGVNIFYKLAGNIGMSLSVLIAYRFLFAALVIVPLALFIERKSRPKLTLVVVCQAFLCGLLGTSLAQNLYAKSLVLTSATFASAMTNLIPAITLILSVSFGMERLGFGTWAGKAKVVGTLLCIGGAMLLTFYKGAEINLWSTRVDLLHKGQNQGGHVAASHQKAGDLVLGALLVVGFCFSMAMALIIQAKMMRIYPCPYSITAMMITFGAIQAVGFALCTEKDLSQWRLGWDIRLLTVSYTGIVASGAMFTLMAYCVHMRGPLFVSVFNPLMLVLVAIAGSLVLDEKLHLGIVLGAVVIICGLYMVLWGKSKELKRIAQLMPSKSSRESESKELKRISQVMPPECIDIIIASSLAENSKRNSSCRSINTLVVIPNDVSMAYTLDDPFEEEIQEQVEEEDDDDCDNEGKGENSEADAKV